MNREELLKTVRRLDQISAKQPGGILPIRSALLP